VKNSNWIKNSLLLVVSTLFALLIVEIVLRFFVADKLYTGKIGRSLYYSSPTFKVEDNGAVHYAENVPLRSLAVYYNKVEYDTKHHTNNLGFINDQDYLYENKEGILFLGDSFTAGVGSTTPWLQTLNHRYNDTNLYSLGVTGTGQKNFYKVYEAFQDDMNYSTVVILSISDDLKRYLWYPHIEKDQLYFCPDKSTKEECLKHYPIMTLIDYNIDADSLLAPEELYIKKAYKVLKHKLHKIKRDYHAKKEKKTKTPQKKTIGLTYISQIKQLAETKGKKVIFIHLPEKSEVIVNEYRYNIAEDIKKLGIEYYPILETDKFDLSMYHIHDGHPNDKGYAYISSIVENILKLKNN